MVSFWKWLFAPGLEIWQNQETGRYSIRSPQQEREYGKDEVTITVRGKNKAHIAKVINKALKEDKRASK